MTILIIEDHDVLRKLYAVRFKDCEVLFAKDGYEALGILTDHSPDVILLDMNMLGMDGHEFLDKGKHKCPVVIVTNVHEKIPQNEWKAKRIAAFLLKRELSLLEVEKIVRSAA